MRILAAFAAALTLTSTAAATLPRAGVFVPASSLGGIRLGETEAGVRRELGGFYGVCSACATRTWYFTYAKYDQHGLAVEFTHDRVSAVYTLWEPPAWRARRGLQLGDVEGALTASAGPLLAVACSGYDARVADRRGTRSVYYIVQGKRWGFGLMRAHANPCR
jgi:hypothetical protein